MRAMTKDTEVVRPLPIRYHLGSTVGSHGSFGDVTVPEAISDFNICFRGVAEEGEYPFEASE